MKINTLTQSKTKKLVLAAILAALAVVGSFFSFPILGAKCAPIQHLVNILCAIFLGPGYAVLAAFISSLIRNLLGLGTILAFPGSMCGAFLAGILFRYGNKFAFAYIGEVVGTAMIGGLLAYPIAYYIVGNTAVAMFGFVVPFLVSSVGGTVIAIVVIQTLKQSGMMVHIVEATR